MKRLNLKRVRITHMHVSSCSFFAVRETLFMLSNNCHLPFPIHTGEKDEYTMSLNASLELLNFEVTISWRTFRWSQSCVIPAHTPTISNSPSGSFKETARVWRVRSRPPCAPRGFAMREVGVFWGGGNNVENIQNSRHEFCRIIRHGIHTIVVISSFT